MKIEAGKFYNTRDGRKVGPMVKADGGYDATPKIESPSRFDYFSDGKFKYNQESPSDLIAEWHELTTHQQRTAEMIKVMQAYVDGEEIECRWRYEDLWMSPHDGFPRWRWESTDYRIAPAATPDTIDWSHVAPEFKWMARDGGGQCWLYHSEPKPKHCSWYSMDDFATTDSFSSYRRGTCDWKDSLVKRPDNM